MERDWISSWVGRLPLQPVISSVRSHSTTRNLAIGVILLGVVLRVIFWQLYPPTWKLFAVFNAFDVGFIEYVSNFESYKASRIAFFDIFSGIGYALFSGLFGVYALSLFTVVVSCFSLPAFYLAAKRLFDETTALFALVLFALYPKGMVIAAKGMPEAAGAGFVALALYGYTVGTDADSEWWHIFGSLSVLLSWVVYIPAVVFGIILTSYTYIPEALRNRSLGGVIPSRLTLIYAIPSGVVGIAYLLYGPISEVLSSQTVSHQRRLNDLLFVDPEAYSIVEKAVRYVGYSYYDFWWHKRGFDQESHVLRSFDRLSGFLDGLFLPYIAGWVVLTAILTLVMGYGLLRLAYTRDKRSVFILSWVAVYVGLHTGRNLGWLGGFQSRHIFPVFPALALLFGVGAWRMSSKVCVSTEKIRQIISFAIVIIPLIILVLNAGVQGVFVAENYRLSSEEPAKQLTVIVGDNETVAVTDEREYRDVLMHSSGNIRSVIFQTDNSSRVGYIRNRTTLARIQFIQPGDLPGGVSYLYVSSQCGDLSVVEHSYVSAAKEVGGTVVYNQSVNRGGNCDVNSVIVSFN
jgi:hypothetical protein